MADDTTQDLRRFTLRYPEILGLRVDRACAESNCSQNTWIVESIRLRLDGKTGLLPLSNQQEIPVQSNYSPTVLEQAAKSESGIGRSVTEFLLNAKPKIDAGSAESEMAIALENADTDRPEAPHRPWLPELQKIQSREDGQDLFDRLLGYRQIRFPKGFTTMDIRKRAAWLDQNHPLEANLGGKV